MKTFNVIYLLTFLFLLSCQSNTDKVSDKALEPTKIGIEVSDDGTEIDLIAGDLSTNDIWKNYIKAHNDGDLDKIREMDSENIKVWGPRGEYIDGVDAHIEFLSQWFSDASPKWEINYLIASELTDQDGVRKQWVTSGSDVTLTVEGNEVKAAQVIDALISNGKVEGFYVYERVKQDNENGL